MEFVLLNNEEFDKYSNNHENTSFHQISKWGELKKKNAWSYYMVGLKENGKIIAACLLLEKKLFLSYKLFYSPRGYLIDFNNFELVKFFTNNLENFCKKKGGIFLKIDPYVINKERNIDGKQVDGGIDNTHIIDNLKKLGYRHYGLTLNTETLQPRFAFVLDLENKKSDEVLANMESKTRQLIRKNIKNGIYTEELELSNIEVFKNIMEHTSKRRGFIDRPFSYYKNMVEILGDNTNILIAKINMRTYVDNLIKEVDDNKKIIISKEKDIEIKKSNLNIDKTNKKINECKNNIERIEKKVKQGQKILEKDGEIITLGGIIFMIQGREILSLFGGAYSDYMDFISPYTTNWNMIEYAIKNNYKKYNFYGITGNFEDTKNELYGLYDFKRGFGGIVEEYIGEFDLVIKPHVYKAYNLSLKVYNKIKKIRG